jgi:asparagine synthase (glutamine-hydrolysing)
MCGIAGHLRFPIADRDAVQRMTDGLRHRGPDGDGIYSDGPIALGHRRLSIIDVAGGAQPLFNEDGTIAVVFNGEIYNYCELTEQLRGRHQFRTHSDTEVLVHLYEDFGVEMLSRLRGMFAFALWDARRQKLLVARDRFGEKPLYYVHAGDSLWLTSELQALAVTDAPLGDVDQTALSEYLSLLYIPAPQSIWTNVRKLPAGHRLTADARGVHVERYWSPPAPGSLGERPSDAVQRTRQLLEETARLQLRSDVPVAVLLSGGIDSSVVTALAARESATPLKTFSVGFGREDDELPAAREVARQYGTDHHEIVIQQNVTEAVPRALARFSEPFGDSAAVPCAEVFREVARSVKVVLTGEGGDELFAGYGRYRQVLNLPFVPFADRLIRSLDGLPRHRRVLQLCRAGRVIGSRRAARNRALIEVFSVREKDALLGRSTRDAGLELRADGAPTDADAALAFDLGVYIPDDLVTKTDMTAMAWGLEARCPLLDYELAEWVVPMPIAVKQDGHRGKLLLEAATRDLLPAHIYRRSKRGFGSPVDQWLRGPLRALFEDTVMSPSARLRAWLDGHEVESIGRSVLAGRGNAHQAWALLALETWARTSQRPVWERDAAPTEQRTKDMS